MLWTWNVSALMKICVVRGFLLTFSSSQEEKNGIDFSYYCSSFIKIWQDLSKERSAYEQIKVTKYQCEMTPFDIPNTCLHVQKVLRNIKEIIKLITCSITFILSVPEIIQLYNIFSPQSLNKFLCLPQANTSNS